MSMSRTNSIRVGVLAVLAAIVATGIGVRTNWFGSSGASPVAGRNSPATPIELPQSPPRIQFQDVTAERGIEFTHVVAQPEGYYFPDIMSPGCGLFDLNGDGRLDILLLNGSQSSPHRLTSPHSSAPAGHRLYRQEADGRFTDVTATSGLGGADYGSGVAIGDINNDGHPDVYVTTVGEDQLYLNRRNGTFENLTQAAGMANPLWGTSASFVDYDRDGWLDLFVASYVDYHASRKCVNRHGREDYCHPGQFEPTCHKLYRNLTGESLKGSAVAGDRQVRFEDVSLRAGIVTQRGPGLGVYCADFNADGWPDIYVANDSEANFLWINQRDGTFRDEAVIRGVATDGQGQPQSSMGVVFDDLNDDGLLDIFLTHFRGEPHTLYRQVSPDGLFADQTVPAGLFDATFHSTGFGVVAVDLEHDGDLDLAVANGHVKQEDGSPPAATTSTAFALAYKEQNEIFVNDGKGRFHNELSPSCGFRSPREVSRGLACGDINGDGALDLLVSNAGGPARLCLNTTANRGHWLLLRAVEPRLGGRDAYGARVTVTAGGRRWVRVINSTFSYLSASDPRAHFGLGAVETVESIEVRWPDGSHERFPGGAVDRSLVLSHGTGRTP